MTKDFEQQYLCQPYKLNETERTYLHAWLIYHHGCETYDNASFPNGYPRTPEERCLMYCNARYYASKRNSFVKVHTGSVPMWDDEIWQAAKQDALRIVEKHPGVSLQILVQKYAT